MQYGFQHPVADGIKGKCGRCSTGPLFKKYLTFHEACPECGQDFTVADTADGPAFFVGFLVMIVFTPIYIIVGLGAKTPLSALIGYGVATFLLAACVYCLLPMFKGALLNLQLVHRAEEGRFESYGSHGKAPGNWSEKDKK